MVFPSVPVYLDPPNWNQQQEAQQAHQPGSSRVASAGGSGRSPQIPPGLAAAPLSDGPVSGSASRSVSMAERTRLAKIPQPELVLKCPRCDSANTKFCYYNNYSLSQPRHFCKTCRRYWTRGGALRNVPVGGGCRRNKRSKSGGAGSSSKSTSGAASDRQTGASLSSSAAMTSATAGAMTSSSMPLQPHMPFLSSLHPLPDYVTPNMGLTFARIQQTDAGDYQVGGAGGVLESLKVHQPMQQLPNFLGALEPPPPLAHAPVTGFYSLVGEGTAMDSGSIMGQVPMKASHSGLITQLASVKMEDRNAQGLNFPRQYLSTQQNIDNFWGTAGSTGGGSSGSGADGAGWPTDLSGFSTSATGNFL